MMVELTRREIRDWVERNLEFEGLPSGDKLDHLTMCLDSIVQWYNTDRPLGGFLSAVLRNNLMTATGRADDVNRKYLYIYTMFLYNKLPANYLAKVKEGVGLE